MKNILYLIIICLALSGCNKEKWVYDDTFYSLGFVSEYRKPEIIETNVYGPADDRYIHVFIGGSPYTGNRNNPHKEYVALAEKYGDTEYKYKLRLGMHPALAAETEEITVVCDTDVDDAHPAGTPLDDMLLMYGWTFREYINSGYTYYTKEVPESNGSQ